LFFGEATHAEARIYVQYKGAQYTGQISPPLRLSGTIRGPSCRYAHTLPLRMLMRDAGPADSPLFEVIVPDPCFWTPEMPYLYDVRLEIKSGAEVVQSHAQQIGIRRLGVRGCDLVFEGRRTVLRAVRVDSPEGPLSDVELLLSMCHAAPAALLVENPTDELCRQASQLGVLLIAVVNAMPVDVAALLHRLSQWAAVAIAVLPTSFVDPIIDRPRNLLLAQHLTEDDATDTADWADVALVDSANVETLARYALETTVPILAYRPLAAAMSVAAARSACDHLQRDLAEQGDFAGYFV